MKIKTLFRNLIFIISMLSLIFNSTYSLYSNDISELDPNIENEIEYELPDIDGNIPSEDGDLEEPSPSDDGNLEEPSPSDDGNLEEPSPSDDGNLKEEIVPEELATETQSNLFANTRILEDGISAVVYNFQQLKDVVEQNNNITTVYLGADILNFNTKITISNSKPEITIYGKNPDTNIVHTISSTSNNNASFVLSVANSTTKQITLSDINITGMGGNLGFLEISDSTNRVVICNINNVNFSGKYFVFNPRGEVQFTGENNINIPATTDKHAVLTNDIRIDGELTIESYANYAVFNFVDHPNLNKNRYTFTVLENATLTINAPKVTYGVFYTNDLNYTPDVLFEPYSNVNITASDDLFNQAGNSFYLSENANFYFLKTAGNTLGDKAAIRLKRDLYIGKNSTFFLKQNSGSFLVKFFTVRAGERGNLTIDSPKSAVFWNEANTEMIFGHTDDDFFANTNRIMYWRNVDDVESPPFYDWDAPNYGEDSINVALSKKENVISYFNSNIVDLTSSTFNLGKTARKIEFTSDSGLPIWSLITYSATYINSSSAVQDFNIPNKTVYFNTEVTVTPPTISNSTPLYFTVNGVDTPLDTNGDAVFIPIENNTEIVFMYTLDLVINVSVPVKMIFKTFNEDDNLVVESPIYSITNNSTYPIEVIVANLYESETDNITLVPADMGTLPDNALHLYINPTNPDGGFNDIDLLTTLYNEELGILKGNMESPMNKLSFTLNGIFYSNTPSIIKKPTYRVEFKFKPRLNST